MLVSKSLLVHICSLNSITKNLIHDITTHTQISCVCLYHVYFCVYHFSILYISCYRIKLVLIYIFLTPNYMLVFLAILLSRNLETKHTNTWFEHRIFQLHFYFIRIKKKALVNYKLSWIIWSFLFGFKNVNKIELHPFTKKAVTWQSPPVHFCKECLHLRADTGI